MKIGIVIPAYNESVHIGNLAGRLKDMGLDTVVVDDCSTDGTADRARESGAIVMRHEKNLGKGAALKTGFSYILQGDYDAAIIMDGDAQHSPDDIHKFIEAADDYDNVIIIGNRMDDVTNMPLSRKLTNRFMSILVSKICGQDIPDSQCGFRLIKRSLLKKINIESCRFEVETEILIKASRLGAKIVSVPVATLYGRESSQINPFWDTCRFLCFLFKLPFRRR